MSVIVKPIVTEKANSESELRNVFTFIVEKYANKLQIKEAIEQTYNVEVLKIRTLIYPTKRFRKYTKTGVVDAKKKSYKKALVSLKDGNTIDHYNNI